MIIGSRGSQLALWQSELVKTMLSETGIVAKIEIIKTTGDKIDNLSFDKIEGKGFFTKELEDALLDSRIDMAVHSLKDLPTEFPPGLSLGAYCAPEDPSELLLIHTDKFDPENKLGLVEKTVVGTSSVRREAQINYLRKDITIKPLRGNVPTRIKKLRDGMYDAIVIAHAGVKRLDLDLSYLKSVVLKRSELLPAPGQGILAIEIRSGDNKTAEAVKPLNDHIAQQRALLERGLLAKMQGGCQLPLAVNSEITDGEYKLQAFLGRQSDGEWIEPLLYSGNDKDMEKLIDSAFKYLSSAD